MVTRNYRDTGPIYSQIAQDYREQITAGVLREGDRMPSVRELAASLAINPNTIQRAYRELEAGGWIVTHPGKGCFVHGVPGSAGAKKEELLKNFDEIAAALEAMGVTREALARRLTEGGQDDA